MRFEATIRETSILGFLLELGMITSLIGWVTFCLVIPYCALAVSEELGGPEKMMEAISDSMAVGMTCMLFGVFFSVAAIDKTSARERTITTTLKGLEGKHVLKIKVKK